MENSDFSPFIDWKEEIRAKYNRFILLDQKEKLQTVNFHLYDLFRIAKEKI